LTLGQPLLDSCGGHYRPEEIAEHYNYFRDYDPAIGRYVQSDPIGLDGGLNTYGYAEGDPLGYTDPEGLSKGGPRPPRGMGNGNGGARGPTLRPYRPQNLEPAFIYSTETLNQCGICLRVYFIADTNGTSRSGHRRSANEQFYDYLKGPSGPTNAGQIMRQMGEGRGQFRNPDGYEWHHPNHHSGQVWLVTRCDHRDSLFQPELHPNGRGGFAEFFGGTK
jgi:RHS repeat-associated protein